MKRIFNTSSNQTVVNAALLILRIGIACFMLTHGWPKLMKLLAGGEIQFLDPFGLGAIASFVLAIFAEVLCSFLLLFGLATRWATIPLIITMLVAIFVAHAADGFQKQELPGHYVLVYLFLLLVGPGKYSLDYFIGRKLSRKYRAF
ncbi:DoxX family protein [Pedobacter quisquiliarum]|uniref:DoxX family protein n=1 Tax=Pedobacter quisquiliarum TaxID=1834438 RepID=UPI00166982ED|nr:DoxX family protein [Pedobacter quisquiliarum]